jgi:hypothetical protein
LCGGYVHLSVTSMSPETIRFLKIWHMRFSVNSSGISDCQAHWSKWMPSLYNPINILSVYSVSQIFWNSMWETSTRIQKAVYIFSHFNG